MRKLWFWRYRAAYYMPEYTIFFKHRLFKKPEMWKEVNDTKPKGKSFTTIYFDESSSINPEVVKEVLK